MNEEDKQKYITMQQKVLKKFKTQYQYICGIMFTKEPLSGEGGPFWGRETNGGVQLGFGIKFAGSYSTDTKNILNALYNLCVILDTQLTTAAALGCRLYSYGNKVYLKQAN